MSVTLALPPAALMRSGPEMAAETHRELTAVIAGHPGAVETYTFYEVLDDWLGPWGSRGYPIGYGKFYNVLFSGNERLQADPNARQWVWSTTILLQEALRDYVVERVRAGSLHSLTEPELRAAAFRSHPQAYTRGGLATVTLVAPELVPVIISIPGAEFIPTAANFRPTIRQAFQTAALVAPEMTGTTLAAGAGPAHTGIFRIAIQRDIRRRLDFHALGRELTGLEHAIKRGEVDYVPALDALIDGLNARQFPDQGFARLAREVIEAAKQRRRHLQGYYQQMLVGSPEVQQRVQQSSPEVLRTR